MTTILATDRCDSCGARAQARVTLPSGAELLLCQHHAREHDDVLRAAGATIETTPRPDEH